MLPIVRATTTSNGQSRKQRPTFYSTYKANEPDIDYLQALKIIDRNRRQPDTTPSLTTTKIRRPNAIKIKNPKSSFQFASTLTPVAQEAMIKTYEDTLVSHITDTYSSKRIAAILPRLSTAKFRNSSPTRTNTSCNLDYIQRAQNLIDNILTHSTPKYEILNDYIQWHHEWTKQIVN